MSNTKQKIKISIITPSFNRKYCIMTAIKSVQRQKTNFFDYEIIVSDDGSTDGTKELFKKKNKKIKYFWHKNFGVNIARNLAIKKARGELILFLDSDDFIANNTFDVLEKNYDKLTEVNFFGTINKDTNKKMYKLNKPGKYKYKDWLKGDDIGGEFLTVIKKDVFKKDMFDEERFCFESFFWNRVIKKYGVSAFDTHLRLYSFEQENRLSKQLLSPEKAEKRYKDYIIYLNRFEKDYLQYNLKKQLGEILFITGYYALAAGNKKEAKAYFKRAFKSGIYLKSGLGITLTFTNKRIFNSISSILKKNS